MVEFGIGVDEYEGAVQISRRVFQKLLPETPRSQRCVEAYHLHQTRLELIDERKVYRASWPMVGMSRLPDAICGRGKIGRVIHVGSVIAGLLHKVKQSCSCCLLPDENPIKHCSDGTNRNWHPPLLACPFHDGRLARFRAGVGEAPEVLWEEETIHRF